MPSDKIKRANKFQCGFCYRTKSGAYRVVDGIRSCEACNRLYDPPKEDFVIKCPVCQQDWAIVLRG